MCMLVEKGLLLQPATDHQCWGLMLLLLTTRDDLGFIWSPEFTCQCQTNELQGENFPFRNCQLTTYDHTGAAPKTD